MLDTCIYVELNVMFLFSSKAFKARTSYCGPVCQGVGDAVFG